MKTKRILALMLAGAMSVGILAGCSPSSGGETTKSNPTTGKVSQNTTDTDETKGESSSSEAVDKERAPLKFSMYYSDNATLPFKQDWLVFKAIQEKYNVEITVEPVPIADYETKVSLALNTGTNAPDVILYRETTGELANLALNGAIAPISDYEEQMPNFKARIQEFGLEEDLETKRLSDGKYYYMPGLYDKPFYDGGLILRQDFLESKGLEAPKTYEDLYEILKAYKAENPDSYPLTILAAPRVLYRMTMPAFGISVGKNGAGGSKVLSWDYDKKEYFAGATSDQLKEYLTFLNKLFAEKLLDPEMAEPIDGDKWAQKLTTGKALATYAYYDQIGGVQAASNIEGFKLQLYPPLEGPAGAHHQQKSRLGYGIVFPANTAKRDDFKELVARVDEIFFSEEAAKIWCIGVEGETYTMDGDKIVFSDEILNSADGIYKTMQLKYGCGTDVTQNVYYFDLEMTKYDENYTAINKEVAAMKDAIQYIPPMPLLDDIQAEEASFLQSPLADALETWLDAFITGKKSLDADWDTYVKEMETMGIADFAKLYNEHLPE